MYDNNIDIQKGKDLFRMPNSDEKTFSGLSHLAGFAGGVIPFANIIVPLVLWAVKKDESPYIAKHSIEALNFQITITILAIICIPLCLVIIGIFLLIILFIISSIFMIIAAIKAFEGKEYRYPFSFRFIS